MNIALEDLFVLLMMFNLVLHLFLNYIGTWDLGKASKSQSLKVPMGFGESSCDFNFEIIYLIIFKIVNHISFLKM